MDTAAFVTELERWFGIPEIAQVVTGNGGLPKVRITTARTTGEMYLHGAHVVSWQPAGAKEVLFVSSQSRWQDGQAIRGGVPICFPWFGDKGGDPKAPAHGFVRTKSWTLDSIVHAGDVVTVSMSTASDDDNRQWWPADFRLVHRVSFGSELGLELEVQNTGSSPLHFEEALHSYHRVGDVQTARLVGLDNVQYLDKTDAYREKQQQGDVIVTAETDRVYLNTSGPVELVDPELRRIVRIDKENSLTTVVWNPWSDKARAMSDLGDNEWTLFVCVETSNVLQFGVEVAPGGQHSMKAAIQITGV